jgi:hypothetical protein
VISNFSLLTLMFVYRPPKGSCWGHSIGKDQTSAMPKLNAFFDVFFERVEQQSPTSLVLGWKDSVLPKVAWPDVFLGPDKQKLRQFLSLVMGNRVMFPIGIVFPLPAGEPASFEFLRRFSTEAPFKMSAKHFMVGITAKNGKFAWRKPDADISAKLEEYVG